VASNCENPQHFTSKIWCNLELGSSAIRHQGNLMGPKCMFMLGDHMSATANLWQKRVASNCENHRNFASRIWCNLELGSSAMRHHRNLMGLECMFMLDDHMSTTANLWQKWVASNCEKSPEF
jgi:hypothetical protein